MSANMLTWQGIYVEEKEISLDVHNYQDMKHVKTSIENSQVSNPSYFVPYQCIVIKADMKLSIKRHGFIIQQKLI